VRKKDTFTSIRCKIFTRLSHTWVGRGTGIKIKTRITNEKFASVKVSVRLGMLLYDVYYEWIKRESKIRGIYECRCDERLQTKTKKFTRLPYTGLVLELEHLKIETRSINEKFVSVMGECVI